MISSIFWGLYRNASVRTLWVTRGWMLSHSFNDFLFFFFLKKIIFRAWTFSYKTASPVEIIIWSLVLIELIKVTFNIFQLTTDIYLSTSPHRVRRLPYVWSPSTYPWILSIQAAIHGIDPSCLRGLCCHPKIFHVIFLSLTHSPSVSMPRPHISVPPPPLSYRLK